MKLKAMKGSRELEKRANVHNNNNKVTKLKIQIIMSGFNFIRIAQIKPMGPSWVTLAS